MQMACVAVAAWGRPVDASRSRAFDRERGATSVALPSSSACVLNRRTLLTGAATMALAHGAFPALANTPLPGAEDAAQAAKRKINLSGRQRMLSQRMAKSAAMVRLGVEPERRLAMMAAAHGLFDRTLTGLMHGDASQGLTVETNPRVIESLKVVDGLWLGYGAAIQLSVTSGAADDAQMATIAKLNVPVLVNMDNSVKEFEMAYGDRSISLGLAIAINVSCRRRMLSQKMSKEACLYALAIDPDAARAALGETVRLFDLSLTALTDGLPTVAIINPPTTDIAAKLQEVQALWAAFKPRMDAAALLGASSITQIEEIALANDPLLSTMNEAVFLYEAA
ncbi:MAG: hypothetical protein ACI9ZH_000242 [Paracoccaceae bacterium]|jgi:hypothetical protein